MRLCLVLAALLMFLPVVAFAQLSPGPLSRAHQSVEGTLQCGNCHTFGAGRAKLKCLSCHMGIQQRLNTNQGYHARVVDLRRGESDCARCHAEHAGRDFNLIRWPDGIAKFDHTQTGYALEGRHAPLACNRCHAARSYLGLKRDCLSCHKDEHGGQLGTQCVSCHSAAAWKPIGHFDHVKTRFPLTGLHERVACEKCHTSEREGTPVRFKGLAFSQCSNCHRDPHNGGFKAACQQCHETTGWRVTRSTTLANFDHGRTRYPLTGKHTAALCRDCHKTSNFSTPVRSAKCVDCHVDRHGGQFAARTTGIECGSCHTVSGFKPSTFDLKLHVATRYPLTGKHAAVTCGKCHEAKGVATNYHPKFESCAACHKDAHAGQFASNYPDRCESCHSVDGFKPSTFSLARHRESRFPLAGAHAAIACTDCHHMDKASGAHRYRFAETTCIACHRDPHSLAAEARNSCETCHNVRSWAASADFDHKTTRFPLTGAHRTATCLSCHKATGESASSRKIAFNGTTGSCSGCHEDVHAGQFAARAGVTGCASCHTAARWKPSGFDHSATRFPLDRTHERASCASCHTDRRQRAGRQVLIYASAPRECAACH